MGMKWINSNSFPFSLFKSYRFFRLSPSLSLRLYYVLACLPLLTCWPIMQKVRFYGILIPLKLLIKKTNLCLHFNRTLKFKKSNYLFFLHSDSECCKNAPVAENEYWMNECIHSSVALSSMLLWGCVMESNRVLSSQVPPHIYCFFFFNLRSFLH